MNRKNRLFKRVFAVLMVVIMALSAVPMSGFVGLELPKLSFPQLFASAVENAEQTIDYSNLTPNQYMAKMLLNYDYNGCSAGDTTVPQEQLSFYMNPKKVSQARTLCEALERSNSFMSGVAAWKVATFDPSEAYEDLLKEKDYYMAILYSIIDVEMNDNLFLKALNCSTNKTILSISKSTADIMKEFYEGDCSVQNLKNIKISDLSDEGFNTLYSDILNLRDTKEFYSKLGKDIGYAKKAIKG